VNRHELAALRAGMNWAEVANDSLAEVTELRVLAIEEALAVRWPRRILVLARLGRELRRSARNMPGELFAERRTAAVTSQWLADQ
jgi:hypothetical protein